MIAVGFAAFVVYGSLVPLTFRPIPLDRAMTEFSNIPYFHLGVQSRADWVANILLFVPLGFLLTATLRVDRSGGVGSTFAAVAVIGGCAAFSGLIEFVQLFFPPRTVSVNDIVAETIGAGFGIVIWVIAGRGLTEWARTFVRDRRQPVLLDRLLTVYAVAFGFAQLLPLDITIDLGELSQKFREGRIILRPFSYHYSSTLLMAWDLGGDFLLHLPVGVLALLGWTTAHCRHKALVAWAIGTALVACIEAAQVVIFTRYADLTDVLIGSAGVAVGVMIARSLSRRATAAQAREDRARIRIAAIVALPVWAGLLATYYWFPFDFVFTREIIRQRLPDLAVVPFRNYYFGSEFHAFTELSRKFLLALPVGVMLRLAWPRRPQSGVARLQAAVSLASAALIFAALEAGQLFLPERIPDVTDVVISAAGAATGMWIVGHLASSFRTSSAVVGSADVRTTRDTHGSRQAVADQR